MGRWLISLLLVAGAQIALALPAYSAGEKPKTQMKIASTAFEPGGAIPARCTCDGADVSPPLDWSGVPTGTKRLALVVSDPDAPDPAAPKRTWVHWVLYEIPPATNGLREAIEPAQLPRGTRAGSNDWARTAYGGPCPPIGRHRYFFTLYALDAVLGDLDRPSRAELLAAMKDHILATAELIGTYQRPR